MPGNHRRLAKLPTKKDHLVLVDFPREIHQALIDVFEQASVGFDPFRGLSQLTGGFAQLRVTFDYLRQRKLLSPGVELDQVSDTAAEFTGSGLEFGDRHFEPWNQLVRLGGREDLIKSIAWQALPTSAAALGDVANHAYVCVRILRVTVTGSYTTLNRSCRESGGCRSRAPVGSPRRFSFRRHRAG